MRQRKLGTLAGLVAGIVLAHASVHAQSPYRSPDVIQRTGCSSCMPAAPGGCAGCGAGGMHGYDGHAPCGPNHWDHGGPTYQFWVIGEFLLWHIDDPVLPPLTAARTAPQAGFVSMTFPQSIFPPAVPLDYNTQPGGRITIGTWADDCIGVEASYFPLDRARVTSTVNSSVAIAPGQQILFGNGAAPLNTIAGDIVNLTVTTSSEALLLGGEAHCFCPTFDFDCVTISFLGGFRYLHFKEDLRIQTSGNAVLPGFGAGVFPFTPTNELISTRNDLYALQIGTKVEWDLCCVFINGYGKFAVGYLDQAASASATPPAGPFFVISNGNQTRDACGVIGEAGVNAGVNITSDWRLFAGYSVLAVTDIARPGNQIGVTGPATTGLQFGDSTLLVHGCNFGLEFRY